MKIGYAAALSAAVYLRLHVIIFPVVLALLLAGAFFFGDWEERVAAGVLTTTLEVLAVAPHFGLFPATFDVDGSRVGVILIGVGYLAVLLTVAARSEKWWPSWAAAFQLLLVVSHPVFVVLRDVIQPWAYASGVVIWTWLQFIAIGVGVLDGLLRRRVRASPPRSFKLRVSRRFSRSSSPSPSA